MANQAVTGIIVLAVVGIGGYTYMKSKDTTPIGLVVVKNIMPSEGLGLNEDGDEMRYQLVEGTFRKDESSIGVASLSADEPLLVVFSNNEPVSAKVVKVEEWTHDEMDYTDEMERIEAWNAYLDNMISLAKEVKLTPEAIEELENSKQTKEDMRAESIFGPTLTLQSHFVW